MSDVGPWRVLSDIKPLLYVSELGLRILSRTLGQALLVGKEGLLVVLFFSRGRGG